MQSEFGIFNFMPNSARERQKIKSPMQALLGRVADKTLSPWTYKAKMLMLLVYSPQDP